MNLMQLLKPRYFLAIIISISFLMHFPVFKKDLIGYHVWRQTQTQITIENFYREGMNILKPMQSDVESGSAVSRQEFPLMQWLIAWMNIVFGSNILWTRIGSFVIGIMSVIGMFVFLQNILEDARTALLGAWAFNFSPVFYYYTMNPLPDNLALCFGLWGMALFAGWERAGGIRHLIISIFCLSLSALVKLPFILFYIYPFLQLLQRRDPRSILLLSGIGLPAAWYAFVLPDMTWNPVLFGIFGEKNPDIVKMLDILQFNAISTLPELLVNYASMPFFVAGLWYSVKNRVWSTNMARALMGMGTGCLLYFLFEINLIAKVHDYYLFPFLPLLFILVSKGIQWSLREGMNWRKASFFLLGLLPLTAYLRSNSRWNESSPGFNPDLLVYKTELRNAVPDTALCMVGSDRSKNIFYYYLNKKGWAFDQDTLPAEKLQRAMNAGVQYLYSDSRAVDEDPNIAPYLDTLVLEKGSFRVFHLNRPVIP